MSRQDVSARVARVDVTRVVGAMMGLVQSMLQLGGEPFRSRRVPRYRLRVFDRRDRVLTPAAEINRIVHAGAGDVLLLRDTGWISNVFDPRR